MAWSRYRVSSSAGSQAGCRFAVIDAEDLQGGKGMRRVSFHRTAQEAKAEAKRLNEASTALPTMAEWIEQR